MLEAREGKKGLRKCSMFQCQVALKPCLHLDIKDQRNQTSVLMITVLHVATVSNAGKKVHF